MNFSDTGLPPDPLMMKAFGYYNRQRQHSVPGTGPMEKRNAAWFDVILHTARIIAITPDDKCRLHLAAAVLTAVNMTPQTPPEILRAFREDMGEEVFAAWQVVTNQSLKHVPPMADTRGYLAYLDKVAAAPEALKVASLAFYTAAASVAGSEKNAVDLPWRQRMTELCRHYSRFFSGACPAIESQLGTALLAADAKIRREGGAAPLFS